MKMKSIAIALSLVFSTQAFAAGIVKSTGGGGGGSSYVKEYIVNEHAYEFDTSENPNGYYWCGHAAYKVAVEASTKGREYWSLSDLHEIFLDDYYYKNHLNCGGYNSEFCASFQNLESANEHYGFTNSSSSYPSSYTNMFSQIKSSISEGYPVITPWPYEYSGGHFWTIVGYYDHSDNSRDRIYLRDVADSSGSGYYDRAVHPLTFWREGYNNGGGSMRLMFVNTD
jgi:hypothetical protein